MRTIVLFVLLLGIVLLINQTTTSKNNDFKKVTVASVKGGVDECQGGDIPCCNAGRPPNCTPPVPRYGLATSCGEISVSCKCCQQIWDHYGGTLPPANQIPCYFSICPED